MSWSMDFASTCHGASYVLLVLFAAWYIHIPYSHALTTPTKQNQVGTQIGVCTNLLGMGDIALYTWCCGNPYVYDSLLLLVLAHPQLYVSGEGIFSFFSSFISFFSVEGMVVHPWSWSMKQSNPDVFGPLSCDFTVLLCCQWSSAFVKCIGFAVEQEKVLRHSARALQSPQRYWLCLWICDGVVVVMLLAFASNAPALYPLR